MIFLPFLFWIKLGRIFGEKISKKNPKGEKGPAPLQKERHIFNTNNTKRERERERENVTDDALWSWCTPNDDVVVVVEEEEDARGRGEEFFFTRDNRKRTTTTTTKTRGLL